MSLTAGARLGPYQILAPLGAGGMGEVYKAKDTRLDRTVAIKTLHGHFLADPALRARFEREARAISSLDHPNICVVHDFGRDGDVEYLVMQFVEGETLAARLERGPLPLDETLRYAIGIASALDRAHRAGILHRDLKPANVMLAASAGRDSSAKLLDFGLAKLLPPPGISTNETVPSNGASALTGRGTILGTLLYMSPEQLQGGAVDPRSDIFSFGTVLYEMLTGKRAFEGASQASIIAAILEREPPPLTAVAPITPPALDRVVRKCLAKDPDRRWQSAADLCDELSWIAQPTAVQPAPVPLRASRPARWLLAAMGAAALLAGGTALGWWLGRGDDRSLQSPRHLAITLPGTARLEPGGMAISPDGESVVFVASDVAPGADPARGPRRRRLYRRELGSSISTLVPNTEDARAPFFSPDGQSVAYFTGVDLMKVVLRGGTPARVIGTPPVTRGGAWLADGSIVFTPTQGDPLVRLLPGAAETVPLTTLDEAKGERGHAWPQPLPGAADVLFTVRRGTATDLESSDIAVVNVATGRRQVVMQGAAFGHYSPTGHLLFVKGGALSAAPFDLDSRQVTGPARVVVDKVAVDPWTGGAHFGVTPDGTLLFFAGRFSEPERKLVWVDRGGKTLPGHAVSGAHPGEPRISPDGIRAVFTGVSSDGDSEILLADLGRGTSVRLSEDPGDDFNPIWTPDGLAVIWTALPHNSWPFLVMRAVDGTSKTEPVLPRADTAQFAGSISPSGLLAYSNATDNGTVDIHVVPLKGPRVAQRFLMGSAREFGPEFSPDGKWIAYVSSESGANEIYVVPYPGPGGKRQITNTGGGSPLWRRDSRELYYQTEAGLMVMDVTPGPQIQFGRARLLFAGSFLVDSSEDSPRNYDAAADGERFLMVQLSPPAAPPPGLEVLANWVR